MASTTWNAGMLSAGGDIYSTYLSNSIDSYQDLADRICYDLGYPVINLELHGQQLFTNLTRAVEMYSKYAGFTEEFLVMDSQLYERGKGVQVDRLMTNTAELTAQYTLNSKNSVLSGTEANTLSTISINVSADQRTEFVSAFQFDLDTETLDDSQYTFTTVVEGQDVHVIKMLSTATSGVSATVTNIEYGSNYTTLTEMISLSTLISGNTVTVGFVPLTNKKGTVTVRRVPTVINDTTTPILTSETTRISHWDDLKRSTRKVMDLWSFDESSNTSVYNLFTIEQTLAQQTYFSYAMGNYGFDLVSWYVLKQWLSVRRKMLAIDRTFEFNERTQTVYLFPEARSNERFYGVFGCYVEKPIRDLIQEPWVFQYALALTKITIGRIRSKFQGTQLFGGGTLDTSLLQEGLEEKKQLEQDLYTGDKLGTPDVFPQFFVS